MLKRLLTELNGDVFLMLSKFLDLGKAISNGSNYYIYLFIGLFFRDSAHQLTDCKQARVSLRDLFSSVVPSQILKRQTKIP